MDEVSHPVPTSNMATITEIIDFAPESSQEFTAKRDETLLHHKPASPKGFKAWRELEPLAVVHLSQACIPAKFAPPRDVFGGDFLRLEWQQMNNNRQPFYHRNADVDEISYQVSGERTLMTEIGTVELRPGDFSRIPVGIAHDNYGREEVHLLFYIHGPVEECGDVCDKSMHKDLPFDGWQPSHCTEVLTECLGAAECEIAVSLTDEALLLRAPLEAASGMPAALNVQRHGEELSSQWLYKSESVWIGSFKQSKTRGDIYRRRIRADTIQYQISGKRTLVSQRGVVELNPGDFVCIPKGCAYTNAVASASTHLEVLTSKPTPLKMVPSERANPVSIEAIRNIREA
ncbi:hypothetical protein FE257_009220 [Aspergillus nanangensis]|uniref:Homogentisate 1,2-dioxygenase n=1 Tax=Aspergillus nanangensis TaxID=2582783 RepID=A0AAD4CKJ7_ASPNN|nr:hypothetical protein FE257_009220 [Aspergillus nanangensis]